MDNHDKKVLEKIIKHIDATLGYCQQCKSLQDFQADNMRVEACVFNLMQIGELAKTDLGECTKSEIKNIPWKQIYGMRNRIVHGYEGVEMSIVWDTIAIDLPILNEELKKYMKSIF
ncbi:HepT-like ribonuclease domain-containing protein [uncultured Phascolarctobacterium sp.]|uniref:HepT-like ribonuclease domain-containing protein n=1 Tax=uncultured Phascolarctobacterium sp. TaxID=512296 RepID=UPI0026184EDC|nr:HepT-like ribonuclease domain-containing protein [uncultured Phascolarctobacterium sp.]